MAHQLVSRLTLFWTPSWPTAFWTFTWLYTWFRTLSWTTVFGNFRDLPSLDTFVTYCIVDIYLPYCGQRHPTLVQLCVTSTQMFYGQNSTKLAFHAKRQFLRPSDFPYGHISQKFRWVATLVVIFIFLSITTEIILPFSEVWSFCAVACNFFAPFTFPNK